VLEVGPRGKAGTNRTPLEFCAEAISGMDAMTPHRHQFALARLAWLIGLAVLAALMAASSMSPISPARAQSCPGDHVVQSAAAALQQAAASGSPQAFAAVVDQHTDVSQLAMFALGPYRQALPDARRSEYVQLTRQFLGQFLARRAGRIAGAQLQIVSCSSESGYVYIDTRAGGQRVIWRLEGGRIIDVNVGGVWLTQQMRSNFVSVIQRGNGDPAALIDYLRSGRSFG
jgi:ABC-type transporter MlaC component